MKVVGIAQTSKNSKAKENISSQKKYKITFDDNGVTRTLFAKEIFESGMAGLVGIEDILIEETREYDKRCKWKGLEDVQCLYILPDHLYKVEQMNK